MKKAEKNPGPFQYKNKRTYILLIHFQILEENYTCSIFKLPGKMACISEIIITKSHVSQR